jgi:predicted negative regulator of RcsB-dependent stress response
VNNTSHFSIDALLTTAQVYSRPLMIAGAVIAAGSAGIYYYHAQRVQTEQAALIAYSEVMADYNKAFNKPELWADVIQASQMGHRQYSGTVYGPLFIIVKAEALIQQGKLDEALPTMKEGLAALSRSMPLYNVYATKYALMQLDNADAAVAQQGVESLKKLAHDIKNQQRDEAMYNLYHYYTRNGNQQEAQAIKEEASALAKSFESSPWIQDIVLQS